VDDETAIDAAWDGVPFETSAAVHVATARAARATALITNDRRIRPRADVEIVVLETLTA
jgi:hypothetical protein